MRIKAAQYIYARMLVTLNISGRIFRIPTETLAPSKYISDLIGDDLEIVINRSPKLFEHVFAYLVDPKYKYPQKYSDELDYYQIEYDIDGLYDPHEPIREMEKRISLLEQRQCLLAHLLENIMYKTDDSNRCARWGCMHRTEFRVCQEHVGKCAYYDWDSSQYCHNDIDLTNTFCDKHVFAYLQ